MSEDWVQLMTELREQQKAEREARARIPKNCFFCDHMASLWAAQRLSEQNESVFCFPRYTNKQRCNSNSASAAINKWVKSIAGEDTVIHGLRHSFRDRLRAAEAHTELIDQLGGWSLKSVGQSYGNGYALENLSSWMDKIVIR